MSPGYLKRIVSFSFIFLVCVSGSIATAKEATKAVALLQNSLIKIMEEGQALGYQGRSQIIAPIIEKTHDIPYIAKLALGRHWKNLNEKQRSTFTKIFRTLSISTYASRFSNFSGEAFSFISEQSSRGHRKIISSDFMKSDGEKIRFIYMLHEVGNQWKILNITVNGVSDLALKRTEYAGILKKEDFLFLLDKLKAQIKRNIKG